MIWEGKKGRGAVKLGGGGWGGGKQLEAMQAVTWDTDRADS